MTDRLDNGMTNDAIWGAWMSPRIEICDECHEPLDDCECERCEHCGKVSDDCACVLDTGMDCETAEPDDDC